jgi:hypothetical protein
MRYSKAEILLIDLRCRGEFTDDLFSVNQPARSEALMQVMDQVNRRWGQDGRVLPWHHLREHAEWMVREAVKRYNQKATAPSPEIQSSDTAYRA